MNKTDSTRLDSQDFTLFQGNEEIYCDGVKVYECYFHMELGGKRVGCELLVPLGDKENLFAEILLDFKW